MDEPTITPTFPTFPTCPLAAMKRWMDAAKHAETVRCELKARQAICYLTPQLPDGAKATDAMRDAYAAAVTQDLATEAAAAAVEATALQKWAAFVFEFAAGHGRVWEPANG